MLPFRRPDPQGVHPASQGGERMKERKRLRMDSGGQLGIPKAGSRPAGVAGRQGRCSWAGVERRWGRSALQCVPSAQAHALSSTGGGSDSCHVNGSGGMCARTQPPTSPGTSPCHEPVPMGSPHLSLHILCFARTGRTLRRIAWIPSCALRPSATHCWIPLHERDGSCTAGGKCSTAHVPADPAESDVS